MLEKRPAIFELVRDYIKVRIVEESLEKGDALPAQVKIAEELGVSRGSVREAVRALESLGIIEVRHGEGLFVGSVNFDAMLDILLFGVLLEPENLWELYQLREFLESSLVGSIVDRLTGADIERCRAILDEWEETLRQDRSHTSHDREFHQVLYGSAGNQLVQKIVDISWVAYSISEAKVLELNEENFDLPTREKDLHLHRQLLEAIARGDRVEARKMMLRHFEGIHARLSEAFGVRGRSTVSPEDATGEVEVLP